MSAEMATKVQTKTYFPGSMMNLNNGLYNVTWDPYHDDRNSGYNSFFMSQTTDGYPRYSKEQMRQTILKQESIFRHQLQELHRVYKRQRDLMNELTMKNQSRLTSHVFSKISNEMCTQKRVIDLELPADVEDDNVHTSITNKSYNLADLNKPIQIKESSFITKNSDYVVTDNSQKQDSSTNSKFWYLQTAPKKSHENSSRKKTLFGVELCESIYNPPVDSSQSSSSVNHNRWIEPHENQLPHWLMKPKHLRMKPKEKETIVYQMNLDSLQQHSQQFFKKAEKQIQTDNLHKITKILGVPIINGQDSTSSTHDPNAENDKCDKSDRVSEPKHEIDLNLCFDEQEEEEVDLLLTPKVAETVVVGVDSMEIDLETPAAIEDDDQDHELVKHAAEAMIMISISSSDQPPDDFLLHWFADVIGITSGEEDKQNSKDEDCIPKGMDYFEYMTLMLKETKVDQDLHLAVTLAAETEEDGGLIKKPITRKGQGKRGRYKKDFQKDVLPGIVSLSRREVTEDLQTFEEAFNGMGVSWQSKRKAGRGRRRLVAVGPPTPPPTTPPEVAVEVAAVEKSLSGWGKRTRRLPRQRCQNGGGNHQSLALKC